jgi:DNA-binding winged helix-turn-helix (wHTH) protein
VSSVERRLAALEQAVFGTGHNHIVQTPDPVLHAITQTYRIPRLKAHILRYLLVNPYATTAALVLLSEDVVGTQAENPVGNVRSNITQLRRVMEADDIYIETMVGTGWRMSDRSKAKLREACGLALRKPLKNS